MSQNREFSDLAPAHDREERHDPEAWRRVAPFGAGLKRKRITFVPAGATESTFPKAPRPQSSGAEVAALYARVVGLAPKGSPAPETPPAESKSTDTPTPPAGDRMPGVESTAEPEICSVCGLPVTGQDHALSLAHQASLEHSHPPHSLPRSSVGLKILESAGWDPDSRRGLGIEGEGIRYPIKAAKKEDRVGVGGKRAKGKVAEKARVEKLNAKQASKQVEDGKKRRARLMRSMGGGVDVEAYLNGQSDAAMGLR